MRILWISHSHPPREQPDSNVGGMQRVAKELLESLSDRPDMSVRHRALSGSSRMMHLRTGPFLATLLVQIPRIVKEDAIDVVVFSSMVSGVLAVPLRRAIERLGVITVAIVHGRDVTVPSRVYQSLLPRVFASLSGVLAVSRATGDACLRRGLHPAKLHVVPNGVNVDRFERIADRERARRRLTQCFGGHPVLREAFVLCSVGRHVKRKGFGWFLREVLPLLPEDVHYWLAGEGPESPTIRREIARAGVGRRVRLLGRVTDQELVTLLQGADLFVQPNIEVPGDLEGFGIVMLEAGMCGLPTVAADIDGIPDVITEGRNGHLVASADAQAFARTIMNLRNDEPARTELGHRAEHHTRETFAWPKVTDRFVRELADIYGRPVRPPVPRTITMGA